MNTEVVEHYWFADQQILMIEEIQVHFYYYSSDAEQSQCQSGCDFDQS